LCWPCMQVLQCAVLRCRKMSTVVWAFCCWDLVLLCCWACSCTPDRHHLVLSVTSIFSAALLFNRTVAVAAAFAVAAAVQQNVSRCATRAQEPAVLCCAAAMHTVLGKHGTADSVCLHVCYCFREGQQAKLRGSIAWNEVPQQRGSAKTA
jgi:hypothetical protein